MKPAAMPTVESFLEAFNAFHAAQNHQRNITRLNGYSRQNDGMRQSLRASYQAKNEAEAKVREFFACAEAEVVS